MRDRSADTGLTTARIALEKFGVLNLPAHIAPEVLETAQDYFTALLRDQGANVARQTGPKGDRDAPMLRHSLDDDAFDALFRGQIQNRVQAMAPRNGLVPLRPHPTIIYSPPGETATAPIQWHLGVSGVPRHQCPGFQVIVFLREVMRGSGGGEFVLAGSHRLLPLGHGLSAAKVKQTMTDHAQLAEILPRNPAQLREHIGRRLRVDGVDLQFEELAGVPGDAYLVDLRTLQCVAPNTSGRPRIMITQRFVDPALNLDADAD